MIDERLSLAVARLERALARVEALAPGAGVGRGADDAGHRLATRHEALRARTAEAIVRLDALIGDAA